MNEKRLASIYEWVEIFVTSLVCVALLFAFVFRVCGVKGTSMKDTLNNKDFLILSNAFYTPKHGDIVVLYVNSSEEEPLIKRIIGLPGDEIDIDPEPTLCIDPQSGVEYRKNNVYRNGVLLDEPYVHYPTPLYDFRGKIKVPEGQVFVMGDHRNSSKDSRRNDVGTIPMDHIIGKAVFRLFPLDDFGTVN